MKTMQIILGVLCLTSLSCAGYRDSGERSSGGGGTYYSNASYHKQQRQQRQAQNPCASAAFSPAIYGACIGNPARHRQCSAYLYAGDSYYQCMGVPSPRSNQPKSYDCTSNSYGGSVHTNCRENQY